MISSIVTLSIANRLRYLLKIAPFRRLNSFPSSRNSEHACLQYAYLTPFLDVMTAIDPCFLTNNQADGQCPEQQSTCLECANVKNPSGLVRNIVINYSAVPSQVL
jgi:hypothetical protein